MKTLEAISSFFGKYMAFIVLAVAALSLFVPQFTIMPLLAFALGKVFGLETALLAGVPDPCHGHGPGRHLLGLAQHFRCHSGQHLQPHEQ